MKIGILTFHRAHNYGAVLQAYALRTYLTNKGNQVEIIDYWPDYRKGMYDLINWDFFKKKEGLGQKIKWIIFILLTFPEKKIRHARFQRFIKKKLGISNTIKIRTGNDMPTVFDMFVFGSDQIWRYNDFNKLKGFDPVYWGKFTENLNVKKISYAASMGVMELDEPQKEFIKKHLENFDSVSVREQKLGESLEPLTNKQIFHVLDPVFLLSSKEWMELVPKVERGEKKYVLFYHLNYSDEAKILASRIAKKMNCKIIEITGDVGLLKNPFRNQQTTGPLEFISLFANASFVISTSFHGVVFSIVFEKQFYALGMRNNSSRVESLLGSLGIGDRLLENIDIITEEERSIDFEKVSFFLKLKREKSEEYLNSTI